MVREEGLEPSILAAMSFKPIAYTNSATLALLLVRRAGIEPTLGINNYMLTCTNCQSPLTGKYKLKFCSRSCSASYTNRQKVKHGGYQQRPCITCQTIYHPTKSDSKYCSKLCYGQSKKKYKSDNDRIAATQKRWREGNANYRAKLLEQTPPDTDRNAIREFYKNCPKGYDVDHIIPISKGGLHTLSNLQYLTASENRSKGNKLNWSARRDLNSQHSG